MKVLIDHNISPHIARALGCIAEPHGHQVVAKSAMFDTSTSVTELEWLDTLGREGGWAFVSDDHRIFKNPLERTAMIRARVIGFFFEPAWRKRNVTEYERAARLLLWWPGLVETCRIVAPPAAFRLPINHKSRLRPIPLPHR